MAAHLRLMGWDERAASTPLTVHQIETACEQFLCRFKRLFTAPVGVIATWSFNAPQPLAS